MTDLKKNVRLGGALVVIAAIVAFVANFSTIMANWPIVLRDEAPVAEDSVAEDSVAEAKFRISKKSPSTQLSQFTLDIHGDFQEEFVFVTVNPGGQRLEIQVAEAAPRLVTRFPLVEQCFELEAVWDSSHQLVEGSVRPMKVKPSSGSICPEPSDSA